MVRAVRIAGLAACGLMAGSLAACSAASGAGSAGPGGAGQTITLYNGQHEQTTQALVTAFERQTGISVKVRSDSEAVLTAQILQEGSRSPPT
jgi:iron(III) transport system substrate-binding protein